MLEVKFGHKPFLPYGVWGTTKTKAKHILSHFSENFFFSILDSGSLSSQNINSSSLDFISPGLFSRLFSKFQHAHYVSELMVSD